MHLGLIIYDSIDTVSGGYLYDRMLVEYFRDRGDTVDIVSLPKRSWGGAVRDNFSRELSARLLSARWDILLQDELAHPSLFLINRRLRGKVRYPLVAIVHHLRCDEPGDAWRRSTAGVVESRYLRSVDACVFNSRTTRMHVERCSGWRLPCVTAYPGRSGRQAAVTPEEICRRSFRNGTFNLLFVGNVIYRKGLHVLLEALERVRAVRWRLEIAGSLNFERRYADSMQETVRRKGLQDKVRFHGPVTAAALDGLLRAAHLLAVPSLYEGLGIVYLEAFGYGVPVIGSTAGGTREVVTHEREGFLLDAGDAGGLAAHVTRLARDRELLRAMSLNALERFKGFPTWEETGASVRNFLQYDVLGCSVP